MAVESRAKLRVNPYPNQPSTFKFRLQRVCSSVWEELIVFMNFRGFFFLRCTSDLIIAKAFRGGRRRLARIVNLPFYEPLLPISLSNVLCPHKDHCIITPYIQVTSHNRENWGKFASDVKLLIDRSTWVTEMSANTYLHTSARTYTYYTNDSMLKEINGNTTQ